MNVPLGRNEVLIRADEQEKNQDIYKVRGHVEIRFRTNTLHCDEATYDSTTGQVTATRTRSLRWRHAQRASGGTHATYDVSRDTGIFYDVTGSTGVRLRTKMMFLTSSTPFFFTGKVVDKLGPDLYRVHHGYITSCQLPKPKWEFNSQTATSKWVTKPRCITPPCASTASRSSTFPLVQHPTETWDGRAAS